MTQSALNESESHDLRAYLLPTVTTWCWAVNAILGKVAVGEISPILLVTLRWLGVLILLLVFARKYLIEDWPVLRRHLVYMGLMGGFGRMDYYLGSITRENSFKPTEKLLFIHFPGPF